MVGDTHNVETGSRRGDEDRASQRGVAAAELVIPAKVMHTRRSARINAAVATFAFLLVAVVGVALLGSGHNGSSTMELESESKQQHFARKFELFETKPSSGSVAKAARERKHQIARMSTEEARNVLIKWGFSPPGAPAPKQTLHEKDSDEDIRDDSGDHDGSEDRDAHRKRMARLRESNERELAKLRDEASNDDLTPHRADRTDERDEEKDSREIQYDREHEVQHARERPRDTHDENRKEARPEGFDHLEDVAVNLANAVEGDQQGIVRQHQKLAADRNKLLQARELIDKALSNLAKKPRMLDNDRDGADFTIKVRRNVDQYEEQQQQQARAVRDNRDVDMETPSDYWKIPIRPHPDSPQWAHIRRRPAPDATSNVLGSSYAQPQPADPLALEEAASADGMMVKLECVCMLCVALPVYVGGWAVSELYVCR